MDEYRGKSFNTGEWIYGDLAHTHKGLAIGIHFFDDNPGHEDYINFVYHLIDESTLGRNTKTKDKNNDELYEDDIVKVQSKYIATVIYDKYSIPCIVKNDYPECVDFASIGSKGGFEQIEKIGNIHDTPQLLAG
ncbi:MAG: hypothetical protein GY797_33520 [Deltaproteobacteria bacterium]|nr:hypothetical protein [Deltaproteobacteria bacterium]